MHNRHIMIDLETLSTENDAAIIAIGAVEFDLDNILQERLWLIDPRLASGRRDVSNLEWWSNQDPNTAWSMWSGSTRENIVAAELFNWMVPFHETHWVWAGPSTFDLSILKTWYRSQNMILSYNWRSASDLTTLSRLADELGIDYSNEKFEGFVPHNALSDCIKQARRTQIILRKLQARKEALEASQYRDIERA